MATYSDLFNLESDPSLLNKVRVGLNIAANKIMKGEDTVAPFSQDTGAHNLRVVWAMAVLNDPIKQHAKFLRRMLAENNAATVAVIQAATDATIQTHVDAAVDLFAGVPI